MPMMKISKMNEIANFYFSEIKDDKGYYSNNYFVQWHGTDKLPAPTYDIAAIGGNLNETRKI